MKRNRRLGASMHPIVQHIRKFIKRKMKKRTKMKQRRKLNQRRINPN
jgi:hypothetical protein